MVPSGSTTLTQAHVRYLKVTRVCAASSLMPASATLETLLLRISAFSASVDRPKFGREPLDINGDR